MPVVHFTKCPRLTYDDPTLLPSDLLDHWTAAKAVLRYMAGTLDLGITFRQTSTAVEGYCDADFAGDLDTRR